MNTITYETPALYGDHHVVEVRRILMELPGVGDVYASSSFRFVEVSYDPAKLDPKKIEAVLGDAGYLDEQILPTESDLAAHLVEDKSLSYFRHTEVFETSREIVSFAQNVQVPGKALWNCPGMGVIKSKMED